MEELFITKINIKNVRHLKDISISLSTEKRKHLILTGKNGSGKTSVLNAIRDYLMFGVERQQLAHFPNTVKGILDVTSQALEIQEELNKNPDSQYLQPRVTNIFQQIDGKLNEMSWLQQISLETIGNIEKFTTQFHLGQFLMVFFPAKRPNYAYLPYEMGYKFNPNQFYGIQENIGTLFLRYLVYLRIEASLLRDEGKNDEAHGIYEWIESLEKIIEKIFNDDSLKLEFDRSTANYTYNILQTGREKADFNTLSDGYSAILSIVSELILRMQQAPKPLRTYEMQGIVLIDEIETHLHLELQKQIFPFLTTVFPKIQFIVTTHSPFVISSVENAVVYDLETHIRTDALYGSSYEAIAEAYFDVNKYSSEIQERLKEYETLVKKDTRNSVEASRMIALEQEFESLPKFRSPELFSSLRKLRNRPAANGQSH